MSRPISDPVFDIGRDLQIAYDEGYKQGRYDEKVETETSLPNGEQTHALRTDTHAMRSDTISRQDAIEALIHEFYSNVDDYISEKQAVHAIDSLPSVQSERKKGKWVGAHAYCDHLNEEAKANGKTERYLPSGMVIGVYCDQCWCRADKKSDFCPNCGVDMRGDTGWMI